MEIFAGLSVLCLMLSALVVSLRTFALWRRTRQVPELLLSLMLLSVTVLGYPIAIACMFIPATKFLPVHIAYPLVLNGGFVCLLFFTQRTFRPNVAWARGLVGFALLVLAGGGGGYLAEVLGEAPRPLTELSTLSLLNAAGVAIAYFWTTTESLAYYRQLKLRLRLGLADAVVVNRVLLWGLMTLVAGIALVINAVAMVKGTMMDPLIVSVSSAFGMAHAGCLFFAFSPPAWYRSWIGRRAASEAR